jgi:hypothetical protein
VHRWAIHRYRVCFFSLLVIDALVPSGRVRAAMPPVLTRAYDNDRSGANPHETALTQASVKSRGLRLLTTIPVFGDKRGVEAQPLILPQVKTAKGVRDVMVLVSMANQVRGVDATTGEALWSANLGPPIDGSAAIDMHLVNDHWGALSTGVIDPDTQRVYLVAWVSPDGSTARAAHFMNVLRVKDGTAVVAPVSLAGQKSGTQSFDSMLRKQRSSLVLTQVDGRKTIFFASGTVRETQAGAAGWVFAFDVASNRFAAALALSQGRGAGVWMAGQGLAADQAGNLYGVSGNGSFDGVTDFGESIFKIHYTPGTTGTPASLKVVSHWSPYSDAGRLGQDPTKSSPDLPADDKLAGDNALSESTRMPVNGMMPRALAGARVVTNVDQNTGREVQLVFPRVDPNARDYGDEDLGSAGGTLIEKYGLYLAAGKDGIAYIVKTGGLGDTHPADFADMKANCARLATPPVWIAASPGPVDACPQDTTTLDFMPWGKTRHVHATPVQYWSADGLKIFVWGENSQLHLWSMKAGGGLTYVGQSNETASPNDTASPGGMPGGFCTLSSNQNQAGTSLLWCTVPYGDANAGDVHPNDPTRHVTYGRLLCYDPDHVVNGVIPVLWDSQQENIPFSFNKFLPPLVAGGQVYVANYDGGVQVFGP